MMTSPISQRITYPNRLRKALKFSLAHFGFTIVLIQLLLGSIGQAHAAAVCIAPGAVTGLPANSYYPGEGTANAGSRTVSVGSVRAADGNTSGAESFLEGDTVFIIQMQGADIDGSDSNSYGDGTPGGGQGFTDLESTGLYEFAVVDAVSGSTLTLVDPLNHSYESAGATSTSTRKTFQVIKVPRFYNYTLSDSGTVTPWNGRTGGVYVLDVVNQLELDGNVTIDASEAGFRGGGGQVINPFTSGSNISNYAVDNSSPLLGAFKGEGISGTPSIVDGGSAAASGGFNGVSAQLTSSSQGFTGGDLGYPAALDRARGAPANAGGGGNEHNAGGAGGSNYGEGGFGGASFAFYETSNTGSCVQYAPTFFACGGDGSRPVGGISGSVLTKTTVPDFEARLFLGGGGGAGSNNNASDNGAVPQSSGGTAGGAIFIRTNDFVQTSGSLNLTTNGGDGLPTGRDGAGGGGAGGTVLILAQPGSYPFVSVSADGGAGGVTGLPLRGGETQGPGGGGGGGAALIASGATIGSISTAGGAGGTNEPSTGVFNPILAGSGGGTSVKVPYDPLVIDSAGACGEDYGDATGYSDASHVLIRQIFMGVLPDGETSTLSDDNSFSRVDEDGLLTQPALTTASTTYSVDVNVSNTTGLDGTLFGWVDFDMDGLFEAGEGTSVVVPNGTSSSTVTLTWTGLGGLGIAPGDGFLRLRITTDSTITTATPSGFAEDGEVEDYPISIFATANVCSYADADAVWSLDGNFSDTAPQGTVHTPTATGIDYNTSAYASYPSSAYFDGSDTVDFEAAGVANFFNGQFNTMTTSFWLKPAGFTGTQLIWDEGGSTNGVAIRLNGTQLEAQLRDNANSSNVIQLAGEFTQDGGWHHVGLVYYIDGAGDGAAELFLDGVSLDVSSGTNVHDTPPLNNHSDNGGVGGQVGGSNAFNVTMNNYVGFIDEIVYWTDAVEGGTAGGEDRRVDMPTLASCLTPVVRQDMGDAPDTSSGVGSGDYQTTIANNGPRHLLSSDLFLGEYAGDDDADGSPNVDANGDDIGDGVLFGNDEGEAQLLSSGLTLQPILTTDDSYQLIIDVTNNTASAANVYAWIDFDRSGTFDDSELAAVTGGTVPAGANSATLDWSSLLALGLTGGDTYMRVRITTDTLVDAEASFDGRSLGEATDGEVEDYVISILPPPDFGDAPSVFGDAWHDISGPVDLYIGATAADGEAASQDGGDAGVGADGDDTNNSDDEDGLTAAIPDLNIADTSYSLPVPVVNTGAAATLVAWLDFDGNSSFDDDEFASVAVTGSGTVNLVWSNIGTSGPDISEGDVYLRLRLTRDTGVANTTAATSSSVGSASDGEVEDHVITIYGADYGDAPDSYGDASHRVLSSPSLYLGTGIPDSEADTQLDADLGVDADGDDGDGNDDENGVVALNPISDASSGTYTVDVTVVNTGASANVRGWVDFDQDGLFSTGEASSLETATASGTVTLSFSLPAGLTAGTTYLRVRTSRDAIANTDFNGQLSDGEVEDYALTINDSSSYFVEAECAVVGNQWSVTTDTTVSSSTYIETINTRGEQALSGAQPAGDVLRYDFNLPATATFDVYALVNFPNTAGNSFSTSLDNTTWTLFNNSGFHTSSVWDWRLVNQTLSGNAGDPVSLYVARMEDDALIDKFAIVTTGSPAPTGLGETTSGCFDFGDLPDVSLGNAADDYTTLQARLGPYHGVDGEATLYIGSVAPDTELDALTNATATGDGLDELALNLGPAGLTRPNLAATSYSVDVTTHNTKGSNAFLYAWFDNDRDGVFEDTELATGAPYTVSSSGNTTTTVSWSTLTALADQRYGVRFRLSTDTGLPAANGGEDERSTAAVIDGEVEDYFLTPVTFDYGDAPVLNAGDYDDTNGDGSVTGADNAASHLVDLSLYLGSTVADADSNVWSDGTDANQDATDDDSEGAGDDEDGITPVDFNGGDSSYSLTVLVNNVVGTTANLYAWVDFDGNGSFDEDERATVTGGVASAGQIPDGAVGTTTLSWPSLPADTVGGDTYIRLRLTTDNLDISADGSATDDASLGVANNGEIEDYGVFIETTRDFGDAPISYGVAGHIPSADLRLGTVLADIDAATQLGGDAGAGADGDDIDGNDDEDGIASFSALLDNASSYQATLTLQNSTGAVANVYAWIDFDGNGNFDEDERATLQDGTVTGTGTNTVPAGANGTVLLNWATTPGITAGTRYVRLRLTSDSLDSSSDGSGQDDAAVGMASNGEVEDYELIIGDSAVVFFEAECGVTGNVWQVETDTGASEGVYLTPLPLFNRTDASLSGAQVPAFRVDYPLVVPTAGSYDLYVLINNNGTNQDDSFYYSYNNSTWLTVNDVTPLQSSYQWVAVSSFVTSGTYAPLTTSTANENVTLTIAHREDGVRIDKFAFVPTSGSAPVGSGSDVGSCFDFGDAPDTSLNTTATGDYSTLFGNTLAGPFNIVDSAPAVFLGSTAPDTEADALQSTQADGDDSSDEGGAQLMATAAGDVIPYLAAFATDYTLQVDVTNSKSVDAQLLAWIDFDQNGSFDEDERASATVTAAAGSTQATLSWTGISGLSAGTTIARVRVSTDPDFIADGVAASEDARSLEGLIDGETEDHLITIVDYDFGDTPVDNPGDYDDTNGDGSVDSTDSPAAHALAAGIRFGALVDADTGVWGNGTDSTSAPAARASDDDTQGVDDDDGFSVTTLASTASAYSLEATVENGDSVNDARVLAWIDWDGSGSFDEDERATLSTGGASPVSVTGPYTIAPSSSGTVLLTWSTLPGIRSGNTYIRARISTDTSWVEGASGGSTEDSASIGAVNNGEVEDHEILVSGVDFGDAPSLNSGDYDDTDGDGDVDSSDNAASHIVVAGIRLGAQDPDGEAGVFSDGIDDNNNASDDDSEGSTPDDEDGISTVPVLLQSAGSYSVSIVVNNADAVNVATVAGWIDFDQNGQFDQDERGVISGGVASGGQIPVSTGGTTTLTWSSLPSDSVTGTSYLRLRISTDPSFAPVGSVAGTEDSASLGLFSNGEVEDYPLTIAAVDYGDAPANFGGLSAGGYDDTTVAATGIVTGLRLGTVGPDADTGRFGDGVDTNGNASDDDTLDDPSGGVDDEDGVAAFAALSSNASTYTIDVNVTNMTGQAAYLSAWIDVDRDGLWEESERQTQTINTGTNGVDQSLTWTGLSGLAFGETYVRIRIASDDLIGAESTEAAGVQDDVATAQSAAGEIEDYQISIVPDLDYGDVPIATAGDFDDGNFARHALSPQLYLGSVVPDVDSSVWADGTDDNSNASDDDTEGTTPDDEDAIVPLSLQSSAVGSTYSLAVTAFNNVGSDANLYAWVDFDGSKTFDEDEVVTLLVGSAGAFTSTLSWTVPGDLAAGQQYIRLRLTTDTLTVAGGGEDERSEGLASNGEVEDFAVTVQGIDFGDAPDGYTTLTGSGGASHVINPDIYLGSTVADADTDGFVDGVDNSMNATDDDVGGDEGVAQLLALGSAFPALEASDSSYAISINAFNNTGLSGRIYAWIDVDQSGTFDEDELATGGAIGIASSSGVQVKNIQWTSLPGIVSGGTFMRLRITTDIPTSDGSGVDERAQGQLNNGEVEDYQIAIGNTDYGDAPAPYKTLLADDGARHLISDNLYLGDSETGNTANNVLTDLDTNGYGDGVDTAGNASDDNLNGDDDENVDDLLAGLSTFPDLFTSSASYSLNINYNNTTGSAAWIYAWIDFDQSGTFDVDEAVDGLFAAGSSQIASLAWSGIPNDIVQGATYLRIRITTEPLTAPASGEDTRSYGSLSNGEVEDHQLTVIPVDFGDAPSGYGTFLANSGPRHVVSTNLYLGTVVADGDANGFGDGLVTTGGALDDDNKGAADEGIADLIGAASFPVLDDSDNSYNLTVTVHNSTGSTANVYAWIDFDNNGSFDSGELAQDTVNSGETSASLSWSGIASSSVVSATYMRLRIRSDANTSPLGNANNGEVEDYPFNISGVSTISGRVFEDINYGGGNGRNYLTANTSYSFTDVATAATVELWASDGTTCTGVAPLSTQISPDGSYSFSGVSAPADYCIRVVTDSVESNRSGYSAGLVPVQTFRIESTDGLGSLTTVADEIGGRTPALVDTAVGVFNSAQTSTWSQVSTNGAAVSGVDFGFNFNTIVNTNDSGQGSLRQFIVNSNALSNSNIAQQGQTSLIDVSIFEIPTSDANYNVSGQQAFRIQPTTALPTTTDAVELNGETQDGSVCPVPKLEINGSVTTGRGFDIAGGNSLVRGFVINGWDDAGIHLNTAGGNRVDCNYIGTDVSGAGAIGNEDGVVISSDNNTLGGSFAGAVNVISGNGDLGVNVTADGNVLHRNYIGVAADGLSRLSNGRHGVRLDGSNNQLGSTGSNTTNIIAYNNGDGIRVVGAGNTDNEIRINSIYNNANLAIDLAGDAISPNDAGDGDSGVNNLLNYPVLNSVVVSGNDLQINRTLEVPAAVHTIEYYANPVCNADQDGIAQTGTPAGEGLQYLGAELVSSSGTGTHVLSGVVSTLLGGSITAKVIADSGDTSEFSACFEAIAPQVISGTVFEDVNYGGGIGRNRLSASGVGVPATVELWASDGTNCTGSAPLQAVTANAATGNYSFATAQPGAVYCVRVANSTVQSSRTGWVNGLMPVQTYRAEYNGAALVEVTDHVGGESPSDTDSAAGVIDISAGDGVRTQSISMVDLPVSGDVNNVDFGFNFSTVVNPNSSGQGSFMQFISNAQTLGDKASLAQSGSRVPVAGSGTEPLPSGIETSIFMVSNGGATAGLTADYPNLLSGAGIAQITLDNAVTISVDDISLDGTTQSANVFGNNGIVYNSGALVGRNDDSQNPTMQPEVELNGELLSLNADVQLRGFAFLPNAAAVSVSGGDGVLIEHNAFGVSGISLSEPGSGSSDNLVTIATADNGNLRRNVFGYGDQNGLQFGNGALNWVIDDNIFQGFGASGFVTVGEYSCASAQRNQFAANTIGAQLTQGINSSSCSLINSTFEQNSQQGITVDIDANASILLQNNVVTENGANGVEVSSVSDNVFITQNHIFNNGALGIDLGGDGLTLNDATDSDSGANQQMNFPVITSVTANGATATVSGVLTSNQTTPLVIELYSNRVCNGNTSGVAQSPSYGEGEQYHSSTTVTSGNTFSINVNTADLVGSFISLLAYDGLANTSEFSECVNSTFDDYGDAPDSYGTSVAANGARHRTDAQVFIGAGVPDAEINGFIDGIDDAGDASDDDTNDGTETAGGANDDENAGLTLASLSTASRQYTVSFPSVTNTSSSNAELTVWIDFDLSGTFDSDEAATTTVTSGAAAVPIDVEWVESPSGGQGSIPLDITDGSTFLRARLSTDTSVLTGTPSTSVAVGYASDGEVEDYGITIDQGLDYGDAPDSYSTATDTASDPARHFVNSDLTLGFLIDGEQSVAAFALGSAADLDDVTALDDDDAATPRGIRPSDTNYVVQVDLKNDTGSTATLYGWLDFNQNGTFDDSELVTQTIPDGTVISGLSWTSLPSMTIGNTYLRLRLTTDTLVDTDGSAVDGRSYGLASDGEVEDYLVTVSELTCNVLYGIYDDATDPLVGGFNLVDIRDFDQDTNTVGPIFGSLTSNGTFNGGVTAPEFGSAAIGLEREFRRMYYVEWSGNPDDTGAAELWYFDGVSHNDTGLTIGAAGPQNYNRMAHRYSDSRGYALLSAANYDIYSFDITAGGSGATNVQGPLTITGITNGVGGDIAFDREDNMYMITYVTGDTVYLWRIDNYETTPTAVFIDSEAIPAGVNIGGLAFDEDGIIYMQGAAGTTLRWDLSTGNIVTVASAPQQSGDLASCMYPILRPQLEVTKTVDVVGSSVLGFVPGDTLEYTIVVRNVGTITATNTQFEDILPATVSYVPNSTTMNGAAVADVSGDMPFSTAATINSSGQVAGNVSVDTDSLNNEVVITFQVTVNSDAAITQVCNSGTVQRDPSSVTGEGAIVTVVTDDPTTTDIDDQTCIDKVDGFAITGSVFEDVDVNQVFDGTETGLSGITVVLRDNNAGTCEAVTTAADGSYSFFPVLAGDFTVYEAVGESALAPTCPPTQNDPNSYVSSTNNSIDITVTNADVTDQDFGDVRQPLFSPNGSAVLQPGNSYVYSHTFTPRADGSVAFSFNETAIPLIAGWSVTLYQDNDCDLMLSGPDSLITGVVAATANTDICILARVTAPSSASAGNQHIVEIEADFDFAGTVVANTVLTVTDTTTVVSADDGSLLLIKTVENITPTSPYYDNGVEQVSNEGEPGDELLYRIKFQNVGSTPITNVDIFDSTPSFTALSVSIPSNCVDARETAISPQVPSGLSCTVLTPAAVDNIIGYSGSIQWQLLGTLGAGEQGVVLFSVTID